MLVNETDANAAEVLADVARRIYDTHMVSAFEGNLSVRIGDHILITPSGICKGLLDPDMLVETDLYGRETHPGGRFRASSEVRLHAAIYRTRSDVRSVCHTHSPYATAFAIRRRPLSTDQYPEVKTLYGEIPVAAFGTPGTDEIWQDVVRLIPDYNIVLMANHGPVSVGSSIWEAFLRMESCESIARVLYLAEGLKSPELS